MELPGGVDQENNEEVDRESESNNLQISGQQLSAVIKSNNAD